jgi:hypothetical protein
MRELNACSSEPMLNDAFIGNSLGEHLADAADGVAHNQADGKMLFVVVHNTLGETCRVLMARGITGPFETLKEGVPYVCMRGDIERTAGLTVEEGSARSPRFKSGSHTAQFQDAISQATGSAPAREEDGPVGSSGLYDPEF